MIYVIPSSCKNDKSVLFEHTNLVSQTLFNKKTILIQIKRKWNHKTYLYIWKLTS